MKTTKDIIVTILIVKIVIFLLIFFSYTLLPFNKNIYAWNFVYPSRTPVTLETAYKTWDAQHYLFLSEKGYQKDIDSNAFPPLFPFLIFLGNFLIKSSFWSGIIISNVLSAIAFLLFYFLVKRVYSGKIAYASLVALLVFPTSFYFSLIYTESLFLFLCLVFFLFLFKKRLFFASLIAFFLPLARTVGAAIILPFLTSFLLEYHGHKLTDEVVVVVKTLFSKKTIYLFSSLLGFLSSMGIMYIFTRDPFAQFHALQNFISHHSLTSLYNPLFFLQQLFTFPLALHGFTNSVLDRLFFFGFLGFLPLIFRRVSLTLFVYAVVFGILPVLSGSFMSYMRYLLVIFPIFIALGKMSVEEKYKNYVFPFLFASIMLQALFIIMQALNYWVS